MKNLCFALCIAIVFCVDSAFGAEAGMPQLDPKFWASQIFWLILIFSAAFNPLLKNKKVLLSPHSATFTNECKSRMSLETTKNIIDFFENKIDKSMIVKL